jgi:hypothetical protein
MGRVQSMLSSQPQLFIQYIYVYTISVMVPWFDSIEYNAVMCSLPRFYGNERIQPDSCQVV